MQQCLGFLFLLYFCCIRYPVLRKPFLTTATLFGVMSVYGYTTNSDLTNMGSFLIMGLFGLIIATVINMFMRSSGIDLALAIIGSFIFIGLTAYDMQKIKWIYSSAGPNP